MEVSGEEMLTGVQLIDKVVSLTQMPHSLMQEELGQIIENSGHVPEALTLNQLREAMLAYLEALYASCSEESEPGSIEVPQ